MHLGIQLSEFFSVLSINVFRTVGHPLALAVQMSTLNQRYFSDLRLFFLCLRSLFSPPPSSVSHPPKPSPFPTRLTLPHSHVSLTLSLSRSRFLSPLPRHSWAWCGLPLYSCSPSPVTLGLLASLPLLIFGSPPSPSLVVYAHHFSSTPPSLPPFPSPLFVCCLPVPCSIYNLSSLPPVTLSPSLPPRQGRCAPLYPFTPPLSTDDVHLLYPFLPLHLRHGRCAHIPLL